MSDVDARFPTDALEAYRHRGDVERALHLLEPADQTVYALVGDEKVPLTEAISAPRHAGERTGAAARVNPDDIRMFWLLLGLNVVFALAAFGASFSGQYAMAQYTALPEWLWWLVPLFIDLPLVYSSLSASVFRRRGQGRIVPWLVMGALCTLSSTINVIHVLSSASWALTAPNLVGSVVMGAAPLLLLLGFEEIVRLGVKPITRKDPA